MNPRNSLQAGDYCFLKMLLLEGVSEVEGLGVQIIKRSVPDDDGK
jgi:hypothetical protein